MVKLIRDEGILIEAAVDCLSTTLRGNQPAFPLWEAFHHPLSPLSRKSKFLRNLQNNSPLFNIQMLHRKVLDPEDGQYVWMIDDNMDFAT